MKTGITTWPQTDTGLTNGTSYDYRVIARRHDRQPVDAVGPGVGHARRGAAAGRLRADDHGRRRGHRLLALRRRERHDRSGDRRPGHRHLRRGTTLGQPGLLTGDANKAVAFSGQREGRPSATCSTSPATRRSRSRRGSSRRRSTPPRGGSSARSRDRRRTATTWSPAPPSSSSRACTNGAYDTLTGPALVGGRDLPRGRDLRRHDLAPVRQRRAGRLRHLGAVAPEQRPSPSPSARSRRAAATGPGTIDEPAVYSHRAAARTRSRSTTWRARPAASRRRTRRRRRSPRRRRRRPGTARRR